MTSKISVNEWASACEVFELYPGLSEPEFRKKMEERAADTDFPFNAYSAAHNICAAMECSDKARAWSEYQQVIDDRGDYPCSSEFIPTDDPNGFAWPFCKVPYGRLTFRNLRRSLGYVKPNPLGWFTYHVTDDFGNLQPVNSALLRITSQP